MTHQIWKIYHKKEQIKQYNLFENERIKLLNVSDLSINGIHYNQLNPYWNEGVGIIYPYLNNIKSDIIGFQHYRRWYHSELNNLRLNDIINNKIQVFQDREVDHYDDKIQLYKYKALANHMYFWGLLYNGFYDDLIYFLKNNFPQYLESEKAVHNMCGHSLFVCKWELYVKLAQLILGYMQYNANKYKFDINNPNDWKELIDEKIISFNIKHNINTGSVSWFPQQKHVIEYDKNPELQYRSFGMMVEYFVSMFAYHYGFVYDKNNGIHFVNI